MCLQCLKENCPDRVGTYLKSIHNNDAKGPEGIRFGYTYLKSIHNNDAIGPEGIKFGCTYLKSIHNNDAKWSKDTMCLDTGSYMMNFAGCAQCQACEPIKIVNVQRTEDEDNDEEFVTFQHVCHECEHVIANHEYTFRVVDEYQVYQMYCALCGHGEDERSIMPCDPRGPKD